MSKCDRDKEFLTLLSKTLDETLDFEDSEIIKTVDEIRIIVDEQLVPAIEEISYIDKYKIIERIKSVCRNISLYMYFPELIGKSIIGFYHPDIKLKQLIYLQYLTETLEKSDLWFEDVPVFLGTDEKRQMITCLNIADKSIEMSNSEYSKLLKYVKEEGMRLGSLLEAVYIPVDTKQSNIMAGVIPEKSRKDNRYYGTVCDAMDVLVISGAEASEEVLRKFRNISVIYLQGNISADKIKALKTYCDNERIHIVTDEKDIFKAIAGTSLIAGKNNFCFRYYLENQLYEITWYLAERKKVYESAIKNINTDLIYKDEDPKAGKEIKTIQNLYRDKINDIVTQYKVYKEIVDRLVEKIDALQQQFGIKEREGFLNNHLPMAEPMAELLVKRLGTLEAFPENNAKQTARNYKILCGMNYNFITEAIYTNYIGAKMYKNVVESCLNESCKSDFLKHIQVQMGYEKNVDYKRLTGIMPDRLNPLESYIQGCVLLEKGRKEEAKSCLNVAAKNGIEEAGKVIVDKLKPTFGELVVLAEYGVAIAAYQTGKKLCMESDKEFDEKGIKYLNIAAAKNYINATILLGDIYYRNSLELKDTFLMAREKASYEFGGGRILKKKNREIALRYYLVAERQGSQNSKIYDRIAKIYLDEEDYKQACAYFKKMNTADSNYYLGVIYENGLGCAVDKQKALEYYDIASEKDHPDADKAFVRVASQLLLNDDDDYEPETKKSDVHTSGWFKHLIDDIFLK